MLRRPIELHSHDAPYDKDDRVLATATEMRRHMTVKETDMHVCSTPRTNPNTVGFFM